MFYEVPQEAARQKASDTERLTEELRNQYAWAVAYDGTMSNYARAAKNLKIELARTFPLIKFSVRSKSYSGGNSIDIYWELGPTTEEVRAISSKYQDGSFDGMTDMHDYDNSAYGRAVDSVLGRAKYVSESRRIPEAIFEQVGRDLCELQQVEYKRDCHNLLGENDGLRLNDHVYQVMSRTGFTADESYAGVERTPYEESETARDWCRIIKTKPKARPEPVKSATNHPCPICAAPLAPVPFESRKYACSCGFKVTFKAQPVQVSENPDKGGIEIRFEDRPTDTVLAALKAAGWRWSKFNKCWYQKATDKARAFAQALTA